MSSNTKTIYNIMNASNRKDKFGKKIYHIRTYQRGYRWGIQQINNLLNDIYINYKKYHKYLSKNKNTGYEYCIQPLVVKFESEEDNTKTYSVIDGQQRLTSLGLLFCALNELEYNGKYPDKTDRIEIIYDRDTSKSVIDEIRKLCKENGIEKIDIEGLSLEDLYCIFEDNSKTDDKLKVYKNEINGYLEKASIGCNIDKAFMVNAYSYLYFYFKIIINQENNENSYFSFLGSETDETMDYSADRLPILRDIYKYYTTVIWYEPLKNQTDSSITEEDVFENFNSRKIPLTKSELVKALFMNPDNYIKEGMQDYNNEAIKTKQIMIGIKWDDIEKQLHNPEMWHFFPHYDKWHSQTRFDAIIDCFVYSEYMRRHPETSKEGIENIFITDTDNLFSYKQLEMWIKSDLSSARNSSKKSKIMKEWWDAICTVYEDYSVYFRTDSDITKLFHRISLIEWMNNEYFHKIGKKADPYAYFDQLEKNKKLFEKLSEAANDKKVQVLNEEIKKLIDKFFENKKISATFECIADTNEISRIRDRCNTIEKKIKALSYNSNNVLIEAFLMIFSLNIMENDAASISRFSFYQYASKDAKKNEEDWVLEHIMATGTNLNECVEGCDTKAKIDFIKNVINCGWEDYTKFKFEGVLDEEDIDNINNYKRDLVSKLGEIVEEYNENPDDKIIPNIIFNPLSNDVYEADCTYTNQEINKEITKYDGLIMALLKDNSMGNLSVLTRKENTAVSNKIFKYKKNIIIKKIASGKFIPMAVFNVFAGAYCEDFSADMWYPWHRINYLKEMIKAIKDYLGVEKEEQQ